MPIVFFKLYKQAIWHLVVIQGATIVDQSVAIDLEPDYKLPPTASATPIVSPVCSLQFLPAKSVLSSIKIES